MKTTDKLLNRICLDERIQDGTFMMENDGHMDILQEYLQKYGLTKEEAEGVRNKMLEGKFPERQAYNKNGLLVTFPTPEYKKRAMDRGTHFEQDPTKKAPNISFDGQTPAAPTAPATPTPPAAPKPITGEEPSKLTPSETTPTTPVAPTTTAPATPTAEPSTVAPEPVVSPETQPTTPTVPVTPAEPPKTAEQKKAEGEYVEKLLKTEMTLDEAKSLGYKQNVHFQWYDKSGNIIGKTVYNESKGCQLIHLLR